MKKAVIFFLPFLFSLFHLSGQTLTQKLYLDFGKSDGSNGHITAGADTNGNYWNNIVSDESGSPSTKPAGYTVGLINSLNESTGFVLETTEDWLANGRNNGGLSNPNPALLGDLAVATATEDYFFIDNGVNDKGAFVLKNLDPGKVYKFYVFSSRRENTARISLFSINGASGSHGALQTSGSGIGTEITNTNDNTVFESGFVAPKANGEILFELGIHTGGFACINALKMEEYSEYSLPVVEKKFYIDFGKNNNGLDGSPTASPDVNGNYWNNLYSNGDAQTTELAGKKLDIVFSDNTASNYVLETGTAFQFNGVRNGGLLHPDPALLGDLAIPTATHDYMFAGANGSLYFKNLNTDRIYRFHVFGSRDETENRIGFVNVIGLTSTTGIHQMSGKDMCGPGINQNVKNVFVSDPVTPDREGSITLRITKWMGTYVHINAIKVEELIPKERAETLTISGGSNITSCGKTTQMDVTIAPKNTFCPAVEWSVDNEEIAYLAEGGKLYPRQNGTVTVTATATFEDGTFISDSKEIILTNQSIGDYSLAIMGSSVPNGQGAESGKGYAHLLSQWLSQSAANTWTTKNISIGGNNTTNIINRWESDLLPVCSRYVYYGLSLGNEGIHETGQEAFDSYRDNMQFIIERTRAVGKVPVMGNNYPRDDYNETDYNYVKQLNLLIHEWDVPSVNLLGSIDDGAGRWVLPYQYDGWHPNTVGHAELFYAFVPSLFDALAAGKPQPKRVENTFLSLEKDDEKRIAWSPENITHSFTLSFSFKTTSTGTLASFLNQNYSTGILKINTGGKLEYETQSTAGKLTSSLALNDGQWHQISLTHYYAWGRTFLYIDGVQMAGPAISENLVPIRFYLNDFEDALESVDFRELFFHRAGMNADEIQALHEGRMLKSSLEIYAPLNGGAATEQEILENLAQSLNVLRIMQQGDTAFETLEYLYEISGTKTLAGQHGRKYWHKMQRIAGDYPALWGGDMHYLPTNGAGSLQQWRSLMTHDAKKRWEEGAVVSMMFHACPPTEPEPCDWWGNGDKGVLGTLSDQQWQELITDGTLLNNNWKTRLDVIYPYLKELDDAGVELLFRPLHEMNQGAFWWGGRPGPNGTRRLFQITRDYLEKVKGLTNLIWVWNIQDFSTLASDLNEYDPGSDYWDMLTLDVYWSDGRGYTSDKYNLIKNKAAGKPIAIGECDVLPSSTILTSQPDWTFFMAWSELTQQKNSDATIRNVYNSSNVLTLNQTGRGTGLSDNPNQWMVCNFDDVFPFLSTSGGLHMDYAEAPGDSPASGQTGVVRVPDNDGSSGGNHFSIWIDEFIDPRDYVGISFLAQAPSTVAFAAKLEQSLAANNIAQIQDWNYNNYRYTGAGAWQEVRISFDKIKEDLATRLAANPALDPMDYDRIVIVPAPYLNRHAFTLNIDDIRLRSSWDTGIPLATNDDAIHIFAADGTIRATASDGSPVVLKVYALSGQEIAGGINQVQLGMKGVYIVRAATINASRISKIAVQ